MHDIWMKPLAGDDVAVVLWNRGICGTHLPLTVNWTQLGLPAAQAMEVRDLFLRKDLGEHVGHYTGFVNIDGVLMLRLSKPKQHAQAASPSSKPKQPASASRPARALAAPRAPPSGALLYIDFGPGMTLELTQLDVAKNATTTLLGLGVGESFFDMVSATSSDGSKYFATVQHKGHPIDPHVPSTHGRTIRPNVRGTSGISRQIG